MTMAKFVQRKRARGAEGEAKSDTSAALPKVSRGVSAYMAAIGRIGGSKGGLAKVPKGTAALSPPERKALAQKAAAARGGGVDSAGGGGRAEARFHPAAAFEPRRPVARREWLDPSRRNSGAY